MGNLTLTVQKVRGVLQKQGLPIHSKTRGGWMASAHAGLVVDHKPLTEMVRVSYFGQGDSEAVLTRAAEVLSGIEGVEIQHDTDEYVGRCFYPSYSRKFVYTKIYGDEAEKYLALAEASEA